MAKGTKTKKYTISVVAEEYGVHPQTLRLYEREGLIKPSRSAKGTRYYTEEDVQRLEIILNLTRDLGVNLAGVEIVLNMLEKMKQMRQEFEDALTYLHDSVASDLLSREGASKSALVPRRFAGLAVNQSARTVR